MRSRFVPLFARGNNTPFVRDLRQGVEWYVDWSNYFCAMRTHDYRTGITVSLLTSVGFERTCKRHEARLPLYIHVYVYVYEGDEEGVRVVRRLVKAKGTCKNHVGIKCIVLSVC